MEISEINLIGKGVGLCFPRWIQRTHMASSLEDPTQGGPPRLQYRGETTNTPGGRNSNTGHGGSKDLQEAPPSAASPLCSPNKNIQATPPAQLQKNK